MYTISIMSKKNVMWSLVVVVLIAAAIALYVSEANKPGPLDAFAKCLKDRGAIFYGAFWCPHCQNQKAMFGSSAHLLPYVECSTPDGNSQLAECTAKGVQSYPTWVYPDGTRDVGEIPLATLAQKTGCTLPQ